MQNRKRDTDVQNRLLDSVGHFFNKEFWSIFIGQRDNSLKSRGNICQTL